MSEVVSLSATSHLVFCRFDTSLLMEVILRFTIKRVIMKRTKLTLGSHRKFINIFSVFFAVLG
jgi:hypothetical protein